VCTIFAKKEHFLENIWSLVFNPTISLLLIRELRLLTFRIISQLCNNYCYFVCLCKVSHELHLFIYSCSKIYSFLFSLFVCIFLFCVCRIPLSNFCSADLMIMNSFVFYLSWKVFFSLLYSFRWGILNIQSGLGSGRVENQFFLSLNQVYSLIAKLSLSCSGHQIQCYHHSERGKRAGVSCPLPSVQVGAIWWLGTEPFKGQLASELHLF
jgi:hypothetical protein